MNKIESNTIDLLRFPLAVMVVFLHTHSTMPLTAVADMKYDFLSGTWCYNVFEILFGSILSQIAVPFFFLISGYLFFQKLSIWDWNLYIRKVRSRVNTLFIPYILWIFLAYLSISLPQIIKTIIDSGSILAGKYNVFDLNIFLKSFWNHYEWESSSTNFWGMHPVYTTPLISPLWFIRDLMVVTLCSPLFYYLFKKIKVYTLFIFGLCYFFGLWPELPGLSITAILWYGIGAYMAINNVSLLYFAKKNIIATSIGSTVCVSAIMLFYGHEYIGLISLSQVYGLMILFVIWPTTYIISKIANTPKITSNSFLLQSCFFVYALHLFPFTYKSENYTLLSIFEKSVSEMLSEIAHTELLCYMLPPVLTICFCLGAFYVTNLVSKNLTSCLTGKRNRSSR